MGFGSAINAASREQLQHETNHHPAALIPLKKIYKRPKRGGMHVADDSINEWFAKRLIPADVVRKNKIAFQNEWIIFPYLRDGELINTKRRHRDKKDFRQNAGSLAIMWNRDRFALILKRSSLWKVRLMECPSRWRAV